MATNIRRSETNEGTLQYSVRPVFRFMRPACEVYSEERLLASMSGSTWKRNGEITVADRHYQICYSKMTKAEDQAVASYSINERFMRLTRVSLVELATQREFLLQQKRIWSGSLILTEADTPVAEFSQKFLRPPYRVTTSNTLPQPILLLSIWLAVVAGVFNA